MAPDPRGNHALSPLVQVCGRGIPLCHRLSPSSVGIASMMTNPVSGRDDSPGLEPGAGEQVREALRTFVFRRSSSPLDSRHGVTRPAAPPSSRRRPGHEDLDHEQPTARRDDPPAAPEYRERPLVVPVVEDRSENVELAARRHRFEESPPTQSQRSATSAASVDAPVPASCDVGLLEQNTASGRDAVGSAAKSEPTVSPLADVDHPRGTRRSRTRRGSLRPACRCPRC